MKIDIDKLCRENVELRQEVGILKETIEKTRAIKEVDELIIKSYFKITERAIKNKQIDALNQHIAELTSKIPSAEPHKGFWDKILGR